jgi:hypothetical protein
MGSIAPLTINDGTSSVTFNPTSKNGNVAVWHDASEVLPAAAAYVSANFRSRGTNENVDRVDLRLIVPFDYVDDGRTVVGESLFARIQFSLPDSIPQSERIRLINLVKNLLANPLIEDYVTDLTPVY